jgi:hypothetical protein
MIPGLSEMNQRQGAGQAGFTSPGVERNSGVEGIADPSLDVRPDRSVFDHGGTSEQTGRDAALQSSDLSGLDSGMSREMFAGGLPFTPGTSSGLGEGASGAPLQSPPIGTRASPLSMLGTEPFGSATNSSLAGLFGSISLEANSQNAFNQDSNATLDSSAGSALPGMSPFNSGLLSIDRSSGGFDGAPMPSPSTRSDAVDPTVAGLAFPGQDSLPQGPAIGGLGQGHSPFGGSFGVEAGKFGSDTNAEGRGASLDLSKTNDLLQQLLDEVRKERQPFLPMNDRNASY